MAYHAIRNFGAIVLILFINSTFCQSTTYVLWQDADNLENPLYYIPENDFLEHKDEIKIDSSFISDRGFFKVWFIENNNHVAFYRLSSPEGLILGEAKKLSRRLHIVTSGFGAMQPYATQIVDSLAKENVIFKVSPNLDTKFQYVLQTNAYFKNFSIDSSLTEKQNDSIAYFDYSQPFISGFSEKFPEINQEQIDFFSIWDEMITITIRLENPTFDIEKLKSLNVYFRNNPTVCKEIFTISVFQEYLE